MEVEKTVNFNILFFVNEVNWIFIFYFLDFYFLNVMCEYFIELLDLNLTELRVRDILIHRIKI